MSDRDVAIGQNLTRLRGDKTQQDVAAAMRAAGYKWSQATVWAVEKGERPLRLSEAEALSKALGASVLSMLIPSKESEALQDLHEALARLMDADLRLGEAAADYLHGQVWIKVLLGEAEKAGVTRSEDPSVIERWSALKQRADSVLKKSYIDSINARLDEENVKHPEA